MPGNHPKKSSTEKRDSTFNKQQGGQQQQQQRKNSAGGSGKKENTANKVALNQKAQQAAGAAILSAVTSPQQGNQPQQQSLGTNGLNRGELVAFLNMRFSDALTAYHDTNLDPKMRPETYESVKPATTNAWGKNTNGIPSAWGQQSLPQQQKPVDNGVMANGIDFLTELSNRSSGTK